MTRINIQIPSRFLAAGFFFFATLALAQTPTFKTAQVYAVGTGPVSVAAGDFNGDGIADLSVANSGSNNVSVLLGSGDGTFKPAVNYDAGVSPNRVVVADINGDGKLDIAVLVNVNLDISAPGAVSMLLGNGDGTFQPPIVVTLTLAQNPFALVDVNGDKKADLIINLIDSGDDPAGVTIALGNGDGTFQASTTIPNASGVSLVADLNGDDRPDLAVNAAAYFQLMYGKGDGTFSVGPQLSPSDGGGVGRIWAADLNNDGRLDLILESVLSLTGNPNETNVQQDIGSFLNNGTVFGGERIFLTGVNQKANPFSPEFDSLINDLAIGDFNGDGKGDVADRAAVVRTSNPPFAVNIGDGAGNFTAVAMPDPGPFAIAADLNGDQLADLVVFDAGDNSIRVLVNSTPTFTMVAASSALTADAGQQVTDALTFTAFNGFSSSVQLSCQVVGAAAAPTCSLSPSSLATGGGTSTLTITVASGQGSLLPWELPRPRPPFFALGFGISFLALLYAANAPRTAARRSWRGALAAGIMLLCSGCGGSSSGSITQQSPQQYSVIVTGAASTLTKTLGISLTAP